MPLLKHVAPKTDDAQAAKQLAADVISTSSAPAPQKAEEPKPVYTGRKTAYEPMAKDDYWRRREERDIETGIRIRRSGVWQAAIQSVGVNQYATGRTLEEYLDTVAKAANAGLGFVEETK